MAGVVRGMEGAMKAMDLEKVSFNQTPPKISSYFIPKNPRSRPITPTILKKKTHQISAVMDKFETQFEDLDVATGYYETATSSATAVGTPQDDVDRLMHQVADEAGLELQAEMTAPEQAAPAVASKGMSEEEREEGLGERLRALRN